MLFLVFSGYFQSAYGVTLSWFGRWSRKTIARVAWVGHNIQYFLIYSFLMKSSQMSTRMQWENAPMQKTWLPSPQKKQLASYHQALKQNRNRYRMVKQFCWRIKQVPMCSLTKPFSLLLPILCSLYTTERYRNSYRMPETVLSIPKPGFWGSTKMVALLLPRLPRIISAYTSSLAFV